MRPSHERQQLAMQRADDIYRLGTLALCLDTHRQLLWLLGDVIDLPWKALRIFCVSSIGRNCVDKKI
jgi:hypothetical protein